MVKANIISCEGTSVGETELPSWFEVKMNPHLVYEAVKSFCANQRQGTAKAKGRNEVSGGGKKPYRQKGTGNARAGSNTSPVWVRGGKAHGPEPRSYRTSFNRKGRRNALFMVLSEKASMGSIKVLDSLPIETPKTKILMGIMKKIGVADNITLLVLEKENRNALLAGKNVPDLLIRPPNAISVFDVLRSNFVVLTKQSLSQMTGIFKL